LVTTRSVKQLHEEEAAMNSRKLTGITAMIVFVVVAIPLQLTAQHTHYTVTDLGTLGGTFSFAGGINNRGDIEGFSTLPGDTRPCLPLAKRHDDRPRYSRRAEQRCELATQRAR
jgi:hypothetical protein